MPISRPTAAEATEAWRERIVSGQKAIEDAGISPLAQIHLLEELAKGEAVSPDRASALLGAPRDEIDELFTAIDASGGQLNDQGEFIGMALTLKPTRHSFRVNGNNMYAW